EDGIRVFHVPGVQTCALPIYSTVGGGARENNRCDSGDTFCVGSGLHPPFPHASLAARGDGQLTRPLGGRQGAAKNIVTARPSVEIGRASGREGRKRARVRGAV